MKHSNLTRLNPSSIADFLWDLFQLRNHGKELVPLVGVGTEGSSREALVGWVRRRIASYRTLGVERPLLHLETELARILLDSDLPGGELHQAICLDLPELPRPSAAGPLRLIQGGGRSNGHRPARLVIVPSNDGEEA